MAEWLLYEHDDGRHAVAPSAQAAAFAHNDPKWHRVGPVVVPDDPGRDEWKEAVLDQLAIACMDAPLDEPPYKIIGRILDWHVAVATDPTVNGGFKLVKTEAANVLTEFAKTAPGRLPQRVQDAINAVDAGVALLNAETMTLQEVWEAAGGNPGISPTRAEVIAALQQLDAVCDEADVGVLVPGEEQR